MTSRFSQSNSQARGFTLVEMLVVIFIIAILAGLLLPALVRTMRGASRTRQAADLNSIGIALEAYKQDFGDYPRPNAGETGTAFAVLGKALLGPGPVEPTAASATTPYQAGTINVTGTGTTSVQLVALRNTTAAPAAGANWAALYYSDGGESFGFRVGPLTVDSDSNGTFDRPAGKVYGPYLPSDKFKTHGLAILDNNNNPILYFPASLRKINLDQAGAVYVGSPALVGPATASPMYNFDDCGTLATSCTAEDIATPGTGSPHRGLARMQAMMGVPGANMCTGVGQSNGTLTPGKDTSATKQPYVLWSLGADGMFGPKQDMIAAWANPNDSGHSDFDKAIRNCDDVTTFQK